MGFRREVLCIEGMGQEKKNIKYIDIARDAGVTNSVVSSLFSGNYYEKRKGAVVGIAKETRKRIWKSCRKLGYRPADPVLFMEIYPEEADVIFLLNKTAGGFANNFYSMILNGLVDEAERHDVNLMLGWFDNEVDYCVHPDQAPRAVKVNPTGKFVLAGTPNYSLVLSLLQRGAKVVYLSRYVEVAGVVSLVPDYFNAAKMAITRLHEMGHERIGAVAASHFHEQGFHTRELVRGCAEAFRALGQEFSFADVIYPGPDAERREAARQLFTGAKAPTAVFCFDDSVATGLVQHATGWGMKIPDDLSIIGCNDERIGVSLEPHLSTVHLPIYEMGRRAFERVTQCAVQGVPEKAELEVWPVHLVERASARARG